MTVATGTRPLLEAATPQAWLDTHLEAHFAVHEVAGGDGVPRSWVGPEDLLADDAAFLAAAHARILGEGGGTPQMAAKWLVAWTAGHRGRRRRVPARHRRRRAARRHRPAALAAAPRRLGRPGPARGLHRPGRPGSPVGGQAGVETVADEDEVVARTVDSLVRAVRPVVDAVRRTARVGARAMWAEVADGIGMSTTYQPHLPVREDVVERLRAAVTAPGAPWRVSPTVRTASAPWGPAYVGQKGGCCLAYQRPDTTEPVAEEDLTPELREYYALFPRETGAARVCATCSLRDPQGCADRQLYWLQQQARRRRAGPGPSVRRAWSRRAAGATLVPTRAVRGSTPGRGPEEDRWGSDGPATTGAMSARRAARRSPSCCPAAPRRRPSLLADLLEGPGISFVGLLVAAPMLSAVFGHPAHRRRSSGSRPCSPRAAPALVLGDGRAGDPGHPAGHHRPVHGGRGLCAAERVRGEARLARADLVVAAVAEAVIRPLPAPAWAGSGWPAATTGADAEAQVGGDFYEVLDTRARRPRRPRRRPRQGPVRGADGQLRARRVPRRGPARGLAHGRRRGAGRLVATEGGPEDFVTAVLLEVRDGTVRRRRVRAPAAVAASDDGARPRGPAARRRAARARCAAGSPRRPPRAAVRACCCTATA